MAAGSDLMFYEGLHGGVKTEAVDVAQYVDLLIGVTPIVNLEWIQKIHRDMKERGYSIEAVQQTILRRMPDYVHYIMPQFSRTHINFQRVPTVDTSNPFIARDIPTADESFVVIRFRDPKGIDFPYLLSMVHDSFMSRRQLHRRAGRQDGARDAADPTPMILQMLERRRANDGSSLRGAKRRSDPGLVNAILTRLLRCARNDGAGVLPEAAQSSNGAGVAQRTWPQRSDRTIIRRFPGQHPARRKPHHHYAHRRNELSQRHPRAGHGRRAESQFRPSGHADGHGGNRRSAVAPPSAPQPDQSALGRSRPFCRCPTATARCCCTRCCT